MVSLAKSEDRTHLQRALALAEGGRGAVSPNPLVGAVVARGTEQLGLGYHAELGGVHAEVAALGDAAGRGHDPAGATLYVSLEPCVHQGRQPPCVEAILAAGIARVVIGCDDPSEQASGRGPAALREAGVEVSFGDDPEAAAARLLIQPFRKHARTGRPLVTLKSALSADGFTATEAGESKWISGPDSRALVHAWRAEADAVAVGIGTVLADDPLLTARDTDQVPLRQPLRVVFDSAARLPLGSRLLGSLAEAPLLVIAEAGAPAERVGALRDAGASVIAMPGDPAARVEAALGELGGRGATSLMVEGGAGLAGAFREAGELDELRLFIAPLLLGRGRPLTAGPGAATVAGAQRPLATSWERHGDDILLRARLREW